MVPTVADEIDCGEARTPRFEHGKDLLVAFRPDGRVEFRTNACGEYIAADEAPYVVDKI